MNKSPIPFYDLYGEAFIRQEPNLVHVEDIAYRSRGLGWEIAPHRHNRLSQVVVVFDNHWSVELDDTSHQLSGNWLVLIPAGVVHSFHFAPNTQGFVLSINDALVSGKQGDETQPLADLVWQAQAVQFKDQQQIKRFCTYINLLQHELNADELAQNMAVSQLVQLILLTILRQQRLEAMKVSSVSRESTVLLNFRALIEQHYNQHLAVKDYAAHLHISVSKLNRLCQTLLNNSPKAIIHQRLVIEAKRRLIYTKQSVEEIAEELGFSDPAYFSRFFKQLVGTTAGCFRQQGNINE
ncbi:MAG: helix-turn-helix domain-containing protein [Paraglaciecola sp.]|uniref:helix-turn-helix domain-containing protein n=1 Tax=Paraglaciecola sp. TaxID=1920173 RepID=UPI00273D5339|nr:helix-turn-helix domain-containing protein [Paraglaciecola sp.]MDP5029460.1 helix-turn-helix domain-containing protein [Paraglaciecola sp.]MDP5133047.1 helix-turn-helix domain-containing protein [Paraglaciecola sp.]